MTLNIVLVEPEIPQNTGNIARTCAATGARLHIVKPIGFSIDDRKLKRAGLDYWHLLDITYYDGLEHFFRENAGPFFLFSTWRIPTGAICSSARRRAACPSRCSRRIMTIPCACR